MRQHQQQMLSKQSQELVALDATYGPHGSGTGARAQIAAMAARLERLEATAGTATLSGR